MKQIFISGMYKSGTSWLLSILSAHPDLVGFRELDIIRGLFETAGHRSSSRAPADRMRQILGRYPFCRLDAKELGLLASGDRSPLDAPRRNKDEEHATPQRLLDLPSEVAHGVLEMLLSSESSEEVARELLGRLSRALPSKSGVVLKSADQLPCLGKLREIFPDARKLVVIRDGRDAAVSAFHFRRLMAKKNVPWRTANPEEVGVVELFKGWLSRIRMLDAEIDKPDVHVLRYEDLSGAFGPQVKSILQWLELDASTEVVDAISARTTFAALAGREPGVERAEVMRKGVVGDWREKLSAEDAAAIWSLGENELRRHGYGPDGVLQRAG